MKVIHFSEYGGIDWHDSCTTIDLLKENGVPAISDVDVTIAKDLYERMQTMSCTSSEGEEITESTKLVNLPTYEQVLEAVKNRSSFTVESEPIEFDGKMVSENLRELRFEFIGSELKLTQEFWCGQVSYTGYYIIEEIPDEAVGYCVVENFLAPAKGVDSVQRFYHEPYDTYEEAEQAFNELKLHEDYRSVKEIFVLNMNEDPKKDWYKKNVEKFGEEPFSLFLS